MAIIPPIQNHSFETDQVVPAADRLARPATGDVTEPYMKSDGVWYYVTDDDVERELIYTPIHKTNTLKLRKTCLVVGAATPPVVLLPTNPTAGDWVRVRIHDTPEGGTVTFGGNGKKINGEDTYTATAGSFGEFIYDADLDEWQKFGIGGLSSLTGIRVNTVNDLPDPATVQTGQIALVVNDSQLSGVYVAVGAAVGSAATTWIGSM